MILHLDSQFLKIDSENNMKFQKLKSKSSQKKIYSELCVPNHKFAILQLICLQTNFNSKIFALYFI